MLSICDKFTRIFSPFIPPSWIADSYTSEEFIFMLCMNGYNSTDTHHHQTPSMKIDACDSNSVNPPSSSKISRVEWQRLQLAANVEKVVSGGAGKATEAIQNIANQVAHNSIHDVKCKSDVPHGNHSEREKEPPPPFTPAVVVEDTAGDHHLAVPSSTGTRTASSDSGSSTHTKAKVRTHIAWVYHQQ